MIMEYCEGGNLLEWIKRNRRHQLLNEKVIIIIIMTHSDIIFNYRLFYICY